jgi:hypothetical protein
MVLTRGRFFGYEFDRMVMLLSMVGTSAGDSLAGFHLKRLLNGAKSARIQLE